MPKLARRQVPKLPSPAEASLQLRAVLRRFLSVLPRNTMRRQFPISGCDSIGILDLGLEEGSLAGLLHEQ